MTYVLQQFNLETKIWETKVENLCLLSTAKDIAARLKIGDYEYYQHIPQGNYRVYVSSTRDWQRIGKQSLKRTRAFLLKESDFLIENFKRYWHPSRNLPSFPVGSIDMEWSQVKDYYLPHAVEGKVGFFPTKEDAMLGKVVVMKIGRFIKEHYTCADHGKLNLVLAECSQLYAKSLATVDWSIVTNSKEIARAYQDGPRSCMAHCANFYDTGGIHPTEVYGGRSDISLLIVKRGDRITGRTLVWKAKQLYSTVYGDEARVRLALDELFCGSDYCQDDFEGALLNRIEVEDDTYAMAYVDGSANEVVTCSESGMFQLVRYGGDFTCDQYETGLIGHNVGSCCARCGDRVDESELIDFDYELRCAECTQEVAFFNVRSGGYSALENMIVVYAGDDWPEEWCTIEQEGEYFHCDATARYYSHEHHEYVVMANGETWHADEFGAEGFTSAFDNENYARSEAIHCPAYGGLITKGQYDAMGFADLLEVA